MKEEKRKNQSVEAGPGPLSTPEQAFKANDEALGLLKAIMPLNLPYAAEHIRRNPPSADAIAMLGFIAYKQLTSGRNSWSAKKPRKSALIQKIRDIGIERYSEVKEKAPELLSKHSKKTLTEAISKAKRK